MLSSWSLSIRCRKGISPVNLISLFGGGPRSHTVHTACHQGRLVVFASARMKHAISRTRPGQHAPWASRTGLHAAPTRQRVTRWGWQRSRSPGGGGREVPAGQSRSCRAARRGAPEARLWEGARSSNCSPASSLLGSPGRSPATGVLGPGPRRGAEAAVRRGLVSCLPQTPGRAPPRPAPQGPSVGHCLLCSQTLPYTHTPYMHTYTFTRDAHHTHTPHSCAHMHVHTLSHTHTHFSAQLHFASQSRIISTSLPHLMGDVVHVPTESSPSLSHDECVLSYCLFAHLSF